ncbi:M20 family metallopeptidase [Diaminobutyricibacter sp. McL0608]|uniref:M20 family metallopeptidase n=1 Tax=Leifsonia sp. McL0608 TaxID=3143537 RepID=UPI0031F317B7
MNKIIEDIGLLVERESPSSDLEAVAASADTVAALGAALLGVAPERIVREGVTHLRWRFGDPQVLLLGHHDTVWPLGTIERLPFTVEDSVLRGPGCLDMKTGIVIALHAAAALEDRDGLCILITGDEELGSMTSRGLIEESAAGCEAVFVLEAAADGGALKVARKGVSDYRILVTGRAAHAGLDPERGINAAVEAARLVLKVADLGDAVTGTSVTPTMMQAGTTTNTVPASGEFAVDVRVWTLHEQARVDRAIRGLRTKLSGAEVRIEGGPNRPPMEESASAGLFALAQSIAADAGWEPLDAASVGGASDGNFTAALGIPTLDGLGAVGDGAHADDERVDVRAIGRRIVLLQGLIQRVLSVAYEEPMRRP